MSAFHNISLLQFLIRAEEIHLIYEDKIMSNSKSEDIKARGSLPFAMQVASNPKVTVANNKTNEGILIGAQAMIAAGAQSEFVTANIMQAHALNSSIILRAGDPPQYNKNRSPKSGVNLSKTSKQGFFKGSLAEELRFARIQQNGEPLPHNAKDRDHLLLKPTHTDYQHTMQLDINMRDILREVGPDGDLHVLGFNPESRLLRFEYKKGHGPKTDDSPTGFNGQFVVNLSAGENNPIFYSREWDKAEHDKNWDASQGIIKKPPELEAIPDELYKQIFNHTFKLHYTESKSANPNESELKSAKVFANRARSAEEFKHAMGVDHPHYSLIKECTSLEKVLNKLKTHLEEETANQVILEVYNKGGRIVAGDWDGMALGHPPGLDSKYAEVINVFAPKEEGIKNKEKLLAYSDAYLKEIQDKAKEKNLKNMPLSSFEEKTLSIPSITEIVSDFALARAGCITPHEFVFQQVLNHAYRDKLNTHYGEKYNTDAVQRAMDILVSIKDVITPDNIMDVSRRLVQAEMMLVQNNISSTMLNKITEHMASHFVFATKNEIPYVIPHLHHDVNVHDLYQHGFDMRNPYGSNLEGAWLLITADGSTLYGETQEQLVEVLLTGDFLAKNHIEISHGANMSAGWGRVIERQIQLEQTIPPKTMEKYNEHMEGLKLKQISQFHNYKNQFAQLKNTSAENNNLEKEVAPQISNTF
ncbi:Uncharacterised protein [Legionella cincinnatiensis]|uniref:Uncharacterized protein n=2 Tax=Legionella cincinnatiensis TaxID=28085 RepID=A0A378IFT3_9GAMM|nr:hypothetical protein Lcin_0881 [Legionella cincinnatiensis]STX33595.1 Uncharacterised protein [Legionella cincinnatiensis]